MNVLYFCNLVPDKVGAFERFLAALGQTLTGEGGTLHLALAGAPIEAVAVMFERAGVVWSVIDGWGSTAADIRPWRLFQEGRQTVRAVEPDIIDFHFCNEGPAAALVAWGGGGSHWVWHQHQQMAMPRGWLRAAFSKIRLLAGMGVRFVSLYEGGVSPLSARGVAPERIKAIPNGVPASPDAADRRMDIRRAFGVEKEAALLVNVSSLIPRKRVDVTLRAFAEIAQTDGVPRARLVLVGDGLERENLLSLAHALGIADATVFAGMRNDVPAVLAAADLCLLSSDMEACPLSVLEAMASGLPVVSTDAGAAAELIAEGETGFVVPRGAFELMARRIKDLIEDGARRANMGAAARKRWETRYTLDRCVETHIEYYRSLCL